MATLKQSSVLLPIDSELNLVQKRWGLILVLGAAITVVGVLAIGASLSGVTTLAAILVFGVLLAVAGVIQVATAIVARTRQGMFLHLLVGILYLVLGALMIEHPVGAAKGLTLMIAAGFLVGGLFRIVFSLASGRFPGWGWVLGNGIVTLIMGVMIWRQWPASAVWVIGLFVGIDLLSAGCAWVALALTLRRAQTPAA